MSYSKNLCAALKQLVGQLQSTTLSFIIITGHGTQGKTTLLRQANLTHYPVADEHHAYLFYNQQGIILELGEPWFNQTKELFASTIKQLNNAHRNLKITGIILCVDINAFLTANSDDFLERSRAQIQLLQRFTKSLKSPVALALFFTRLDSLVGFNDFFQTNHKTELIKPLGFSLLDLSKKQALLANYQQQFDLILEAFHQQILHKIHAARSAAKRLLIREFPLQFANLKNPVQALIVCLFANKLPLKAVYFTSAKQGGISADHLNKKIHQAFNLSLLNTAAQTNNYRAYFIEGALESFQTQTAITPNPSANYSRYKAMFAATLLSLGFFGVHFYYANYGLKAVDKELSTYQRLISQSNQGLALYHLLLANQTLNSLKINFLSNVRDFDKQLTSYTSQQLHQYFLSLVAQLEQRLHGNQLPPQERYQALKVYLMLADFNHYSKQTVQQWLIENSQIPFKDSLKPQLLLAEILKLPPKIAINQGVVTEVRNYLKALPADYFYYQLIQSKLPLKNIPINVKGFNLANVSVPSYYTKEGLSATKKSLQTLAKEMQEEFWVLETSKDLNFYDLLEQAYYHQYNHWWQNFIKRTYPIHYQNYQEASSLIQHWPVNFNKLINFIQKNTSAEVNLDTKFNHIVASHFTEISLLGQSSIRALNQTLGELSKYLTTLSLVQDNQAVFNLTKARFKEPSLTNPLTNLYEQSKTLVAPLSYWVKQLADDGWYIFINQTKNYINQQWQDVFAEYKQYISGRYPFNSQATQDINMAQFNRFFAPQGKLNLFIKEYIKPFIDTSHAQWQPKEVNGYILPISAEVMNEIIRANVISLMFFNQNSSQARVDFSLEKINLDPVVAKLQLILGNNQLNDSQGSDSYNNFSWPQNDAKLELLSIEGKRFSLEEQGTWAFFKMLQKVNILPDVNDNSSLEILFEINGNSGRYLLKTKNIINPFTPGILNGFHLKETLIG